MNISLEKKINQNEPMPSKTAPLIDFPQDENRSAHLKENHSVSIALILSSEIPVVKVIPFQIDISALNHAICTYIYTVLDRIQSPFPHPVVKEMVENFIHADYLFPSVTIYDEGYTLIFSDGGPGINEPEKALKFGFYSISSYKKKYIRGMGLGFSLAKSLIEQYNGSLTIEQNLNSGCVITLKIPKKNNNSVLTHENETNFIGKNTDNSSSHNHYLSRRQRDVLMVIADTKEAGPSVVSELLDIALSTAYRDLTYLEQCNLIHSSKGKRLLTPEGITYLTRFKKGE